MVALEDRMLPDDDLDIEVARRTAVPSRFAFTGKPDAIAVVDACRNLDRETLVASARGRCPRTSGRAP